MAFLRTGTVLASALLLVSTANAARPHHSAKKVKGHKSTFVHPAGIGSARATEIQAALIREHYLSGEPTGVWDDSTRDAMARYQAANNIPTKVTPDSRALIKLGLGPDQTGAAPVATAVATSHEAEPAAAPVSNNTRSSNTIGTAIAQQQNFLQ